jgi:uncharacterized cupredoxin-like copper-binding protein
MKEFSSKRELFHRHDGHHVFRGEITSMLRTQPMSFLRPVFLAVLATALCFVCVYVFSTFPTAQAKPAATVAPPVIDVMTTDYAFDAPDTLPAGLVTVRLMNHGQEPHHAQLLRLNDGVSFDDFAAALQSEGESALRLVTLTGGPGAMSPFKSGEVTVDLTPGQYALACFIPSADGVPHLAKGMLKPVTVVAADSQPELAAPTSTGTLTMRDFGFDMPDKLASGPTTFTVTNAGPQPHEMNILKLAPGASASDVLAWQPDQGTPPPFEAVGGLNGLSQGGSSYMTIDLQPGTYVAICNIPDPGSGVPHSHLGMIRQFRVQ